MEWILLCPIPPRDLAGLKADRDLVTAAGIILKKSNSKKKMMMRCSFVCCEGVTNK
jgi:hypothetical protein